MCVVASCAHGCVCWGARGGARSTRAGGARTHAHDTPTHPTHRPHTTPAHTHTHLADVVFADVKLLDRLVEADAQAAVDDLAVQPRLEALPQRRGALLARDRQARAEQAPFCLESEEGGEWVSVVGGRRGVRACVCVRASGGGGGGARSSTAAPTRTAGERGQTHLYLVAPAACSCRRTLAVSSGSVAICVVGERALRVCVCVCVCREWWSR